MSKVAVVVSVLLSLLLPARGAILDTDFQETTFATIPSQLTGMAWAPDGSNRLFLLAKNGTVHILKNGTVLPTPFTTVSPIFTANECGLIGICFDPNFMVNGFVYLFVTVSSSEQQIIRYTANGDVGTDKTILVPDLPTMGDNHEGGAVGIGPDGKLYWAVGDQGSAVGVDGDLTSLAAKVGRANLDGTVPTDNPFADGNGPNNDYIWARGFRNPYTFTFQPTSGDLWVNSVGTSYEQVFLVRAGDHAGWNDFENNQPPGYITPKIKYRTNGTDTRSLVDSVRADNVATFTTTTEHGFRQGEKLAISGVADSSFNGSFYVASTPTDTMFTVNQSAPDASSSGGSAATQHQGGCVTGGAFFNVTGVPESYRQNFFYGDLNSGRIMRAVVNETNVQSVDYFATGSSAQIDVEVGPDGALYYANHIGALRRAVFTNYTEQQIVASPATLRMFEDGLAAVTVRLAREPAGEVVVTVARAAGDSDIQIVQGATLTFDPGNWSVPQAIHIRAETDSDAESDYAAIQLTTDGAAPEQIVVHALDLLRPPSLVVMPAAPPSPFQLQLSGTIGEEYTIEATTNLAADSWVAISTNVLSTATTNLTDGDSLMLPARFYRVRHNAAN